MVVQLGYPPNRIDLLTRISAVEFDDATARSVDALFDDVPVRIIAFDDLMRNKNASGRPRDLADAAQLERARKRRDGA